ncbi:Protein kinase domain [Macleaya cordata]|uniref:non-specific serine/threonine protein kinase n=1 Tax=Macleaya cordata TaxID=56857 RepID=A0A200R984_MACCD|nr:Protein kinase domain [Macleaya cordata]
MPSKPLSLHQTSSSSSSSSLVSSSSSSCSGGRRSDLNINVRACTFLHAQTIFTMARNDPPGPIITFFIVFLCVITFSCASDTDTLFKFKDSLANDGALSNWNASSKPCSGDNANWVGILCSNNTIWGLQLENMGLMGLIDVDSLMGLPYLRTISLTNNSFDGPLPNIKKLGALKSVFLSKNRFSGEIPNDTFTGMGSLKKLYLNKNEFTGQIPSSIVSLPKLLELRLDDNQFEGQIPDFRQKDLKLANLANNKLEGSIPASLSKMDKSLFSGNEDLCGAPLDQCGSKKVSAILIIGIVIGTLIAIGFLGAIFVVLRRRNEPLLERSLSRKKPKKVASDEEQMEHGSSPGNNPNPSSTNKKGDQGKLIFIRDDTVKFDLQDLLRASAEVLGSGSFGSSYKAVLLSGPALVVKRFRLMNNVGREEFQEHMRRLGRLSHPNLLSIVSYYYRKEEKLLVSDFVENGSLAYQLHGNRSADRPGLDWPTRLKIIKGVAKGLAHLYHELPSLIVPHGHLKSSNVLLNEAFEPLLADYALVPLINQEHATQLMVAYKSPEYTQFGRTTKKTDVWSLGILILEMITGKFPANYLKQSNKGNNNAANSDLASWVNSVVREEWTGEVFDKDMKGTKNAEEEMMKLLKIGLGCCEEDVEKRWDWKEAVEKIEELKERESSSNDDNEDYSSYYASEGDQYYSSRGMTTEDEFSFSMNSYARATEIPTEFATAGTFHGEIHNTLGWDAKYEEMQITLTVGCLSGSKFFPLLLVLMVAPPEYPMDRFNSNVSVLASEGIEFLMSSDGNVPLSFLDHKTICLFFTANWCRPCKAFTPQLVQLYNTLRRKDTKLLEIIFVSLDQDETGFKEHFKCMPWLAIPFDLVNGRQQLRDRYNVNRIPSLVPSLSPTDGEFFIEDAVGLIEDYGIDAFPFTRERREELKAIDYARRHEGKLEQVLLLDHVVTRDGRKVQILELIGKTIGLYFGAHWCPPCQAFTRQLADAYNDINIQEIERFEIIFISTDKNQEEFDLNISTMPWLAIPYHENKTKQDLRRIFEIKTIPALVLLGPDGKILSTNGRASISSYGAKAFPFTESRITEVEAAIAEEGNGLPREKGR